MSAYSKSIQKSLLTGGIVFVVLVCILLSFQSFLLFSHVLLVRSNTKLADILTYVEHQIDVADMDQCISTGRKSEEYMELQQTLNEMVDDFQLGHLYIAIPMKDGSGTMLNVITATKAEEREAGKEDIPLLMVSDVYSEEALQNYLTAWDAEGIRFFRENSVYGLFYTACKPVRMPDNRTISLICANVPIEPLYWSVATYAVLNILLILGIGIPFGIRLLVWLRRNVTGPMEKLAESTRRFAEKSHEFRNPELLSYDAPDIHTHNEVELLADAIIGMSDDIKHYIKDILTTEVRLKEAEEEKEGISRIAYQDALTHVKSKAAYNQMMANLAQCIACGEAEFAFVMVDLNNLKRINDTYGHDKGDQYIVASCRIVSNAFKHSPVFRVGGDEFVVLLQGEDYDRRVELLEDMKRQFFAAQTDESREPWERYSTAVGMSEYIGVEGESAEEVLKRADSIMYRNKQRMKMARSSAVRPSGDNKSAHQTA